ncbi:CDP-glycerol glycerophosphotransferase family protein [Methanobacterium alcaliphilum]|uniref:CDP-glycerol glycerophosphotransferase family protein n=1 Tax=Methanobacterium alcaliphilum TaxID=392018 RepID=UPI00200A3BFC|nr:CDP-glycerol glycerophosphotransferase family protein [Methanobacterium alcaliphilum]MCK9152261.1 CDP-glycerol glycerophosphotransferase family protein [Methanobacterium alcaliphilum]
MNIKSMIKKIIVSIYHVFLKLPVKDNVIFFESNVGRNYTSNPKYVYEEMVKRGLDKKYKCVWSLEDTNLEIPGNATKVKRARLSYLYYLAISKVWVCDTRLPSFIIKRPEATYIQLWHGTPLKKLAMDLEVLSMSEGMELEEYKRLFEENTKTWDYLISQSDYTSKRFKSCFAFKNEILASGFPRNDILFQKNNEKAIKKIKMQYNIPLDKKVILYAPTWRDDEFHENGIYKFSSQMDFDLLKKELSDTHIVLIKLHYLVKDSLNWDKYQGFVYECDHLWDIQELYLISDYLITDYSSVMFDYALLKKPMIIYAYDYEKYRDNLRGFYFNIFKEFPGPIVEKSEDLVKHIKNYDYKLYKAQYDAFLNKFTSFDKGNASSFIVDIILKITRNSDYNFDED